MKHNALKVKAENEKKSILSSFQGLHEVNSHFGLGVMFSCPLMVKNEGRRSRRFQQDLLNSEIRSQERL